MANSKLFRGIGILSLTFALCTTALCSASAHNRTQTTVSTTSQTHTTVCYLGGGVYTISYYNFEVSPAMLPNQFVLPDLKPIYLRPENDPKYDNGINGHAQEQIDRLLPQKIMRS